MTRGKGEAHDRQDRTPCSLVSRPLTGQPSTISKLSIYGLWDLVSTWFVGIYPWKPFQRYLLDPWLHFGHRHPRKADRNYGSSIEVAVLGLRPASFASCFRCLWKQTDRTSWQHLVLPWKVPGRCHFTFGCFQKHLSRSFASCSLLSVFSKLLRVARWEHLGLSSGDPGLVQSCQFSRSQEYGPQSGHADSTKPRNWSLYSFFPGGCSHPESYNLKHTSDGA